MPFGQSPVHVCGSEPLASRVIAGLRADGRPVKRITPDQLLALKPTRAARSRGIRTLILADPPDPAALIADFAARLGPPRHRFGAGAVRLILMHPTDPPPPLPERNLGGRLRLETFAVENRAVRALLTRWPLHAGMDPPFGQGPHLLIAGFAAPAGAFLVQALRLIQYGDRRPMVTVLCEEGDHAAACFQAAYPQAGQVAEIRFAPLASPPLSGAPAVTLALICLHDPEEGFTVAKTLAHSIAREQRASPPILLEVGDHVSMGDITAWDGQIIPVSHVREACRAGVLLDGIGDEVAEEHPRTLLRQYRRAGSGSGDRAGRTTLVGAGRLLPAGQPSSGGSPLGEAGLDRLPRGRRGDGGILHLHAAGGRAARPDRASALGRRPLSGRLDPCPGA